ncbi:uncharacterized protein C8Q71DRAFT_708925, partial [Rhodofomes roseus]
MIKTAKKHKACFAAIKLSKEVKANLPAWYHISADKQLHRLNNTRLSTCLRETHKVELVADLVMVHQHSPINQSASQQAECECPKCIDARRRGCRNPEGCREAAGRLLNNLSAKWNPSAEPEADNLTLTKKRKEKNMKAIEEGGQAIFDPSLTLRGGVAEAFRVFTDAPTLNNPPAIRQKVGRTVEQEASTVYVIAVSPPPSTRDPNEQLPHEMGFTSYGTGNPRNNLIRAPKSTHPTSRDRGELAAAIIAARSTPKDVPLHLVGE